MKNKITWPVVIFAVLIAALIFYVNIWIIHWAVSLFYPISMWQAFGISVLLTIIGNTIRSGGNA